MRGGVRCMCHEGACGRRAARSIREGWRVAVSAHRCSGGVAMLSAPGALERKGKQNEFDGAAGVAHCQPTRRGHGERRRKRGGRQRCRLRRPLCARARDIGDRGRGGEHGVLAGERGSCRAGRAIPSVLGIQMTKSERKERHGFGCCRMHSQTFWAGRSGWLQSRKACPI